MPKRKSVGISGYSLRGDFEGFGAEVLRVLRGLPLWAIRNDIADASTGIIRIASLSLGFSQFHQSNHRVSDNTSIFQSESLSLPFPEFIMANRPHAPPAHIIGLVSHHCVTKIKFLLKKSRMAVRLISSTGCTLAPISSKFVEIREKSSLPLMSTTPSITN